MTQHRRFAGAVAVILGVTTGSGFAADRLILKWEQAHQSMSPQLSVAATMGGLFSAGVVAVLLTLLILTRGGPGSS